MKNTFKFKKYTSALAISALVAGGATAAYAVTVQVHANANFRAALTLNKVADMEFNVIETAAAPAAGDLARLGTDDTITYAVNFTGAGTGTAGKVDITTGTDGATIDVFCETSGILTNGAGSSISVNAVEVVMETGVAPQTGIACQGLATPAFSPVLNLATNNTVLMGGIIDGATAAAFVNAPHSTTLAGGDPVQLDVQYQ